MRQNVNNAIFIINKIYLFKIQTSPHETSGVCISVPNNYRVSVPGEKGVRNKLVPTGGPYQRQLQLGAGYLQ